MNKYAKWIGGAMGWAFGGPIGGILGFALGSLLPKFSSSNFSSHYSDTRETKYGDFKVSLLILSAWVIKADGRTSPEELEFVRNHFKKMYGEEESKNSFQLFKKITAETIPNKQEICNYIGERIDPNSKFQLLHFLFSIAHADGVFSDSELQEIKSLSYWLGIDSHQFQSIYTMFANSKESSQSQIKDAFTILQLSENATLDEVKKSYRNLAKLYHPDKVAHLGANHQKGAEEKFKKIQDAYEVLLKHFSA